MDDKELIVYLSKKVAELEKNLDLAEKESLYFFNKYKELENEQKQCQLPVPGRMGVSKPTG